MAANASPRRVRSDVLASPLREFTSYRLALHCGGADCLGERTLSIGDLARRYGGRHLISTIVLRLRCTRCRQPVDQVWLESGPTSSARVRTKLLGLGD